VPLLLAPLLTGFLGVLLAAFAKAELAKREGPAFASYAFRIVFLHSLCVLLPVLGYFAAFHGDWGYLYLVAGRHIPSAVDLLLVLAAAFAPCGTFLAFATASAQDRTGVLFRGMLGFAIPFLVLCAVFLGRLGETGTYDQFKGHFGLRRTTESPLGVAIALSWLAVAAGTFFARRALVAGRTNGEARGSSPGVLE